MYCDYFQYLLILFVLKPLFKIFKKKTVWAVSFLALAPIRVLLYSEFFYIQEKIKREHFLLYILIIFVFHFQTWSNALQRHASEILQCSTESSELSQNSLTVNFGQGVSIHEIINKWFREIQHLYPYEASCLDFSQCSNILTVCVNLVHANPLYQSLTGSLIQDTIQWSKLVKRKYQYLH